jgi:hypothetical protein
MCIYGCFPLTYVTKRDVTDKHGNVHKRREKHTRNLYYVITDFRLAPIGKPALYFKAYNEIHDRWEDHVTSERRIYQQLFNFVYPLLERNDMWDVTPQYKTPANTYPQPKKAQVWADSVYDFGSVGYALNPHVITDDVVRTPWVGYKKR